MGRRGRCDPFVRLRLPWHQMRQRKEESPDRHRCNAVRSGPSFISGKSGAYRVRQAPLVPKAIPHLC